MTTEPNRRSTTMGRPAIANGAFACSRCARMANQLRVYWPGDSLCNSCFYTAMRTRGICPNCGHDGVLPGRLNRRDGRPVCLKCAGIPGDYRCRTCSSEGEIYRRGQCARCALRDDLTGLLLTGAADPGAMETIVEVLCGVDRPESILAWKRSSKVQALLTGLASGSIPLSHDGLTTAGRGKSITHLRSLLEHHDLLPQRDEHLARFESWLTSKLEDIDQPSVRAPVEQFATWHHLRRLRTRSVPGQSSDGPTRSAKQEITETTKFLTWLGEVHHRTAATCRQQDVDEYLADGPTTRHLIRTFFVWANTSKINTAVRIGHRLATTTRSLTQQQRLGWLRELLIGDADSLPHRVAGTLLLLYAQPLVKIAALPTSAVVLSRNETRLLLGTDPLPVPEPFSGMLMHHLRNRPNLRTTGGSVGTPWLFPSTFPGKHVQSQYVMHRLRDLGINLLGARNSTLQHLVTEVPPPLVAELLGYSHQVTQRHAEIATQPWAKYVNPRQPSSWSRP
jgi:hypothetical protein